MFNYQAFGLDISSEIELPGMIEGTGNEDIQIVLGNVDPSTVNGELEGPDFLINGNDIYLWWDDIGKILISDGRVVTVEPLTDLEGYEEINLIPFLLGPVMALILYQLGFLVLHGSSVKIDSGAVAFLGYRGNGKSTTAINMYKKGYPLVADDILAIKFNEGVPVVYPGYPHVRLSEDSYNFVKDETNILTPIRTIVGKVFCDASHGYSTQPVFLKRIYMIEKSEKIKVSMLNSQDTLLDFIRHSTANWAFQQKAQAENLAHCAQLFNNVTVRKLEISHSFENIPVLIQALEEDISIDEDIIKISKMKNR